MNGQPHIHKIVIKTKYSEDGPWQVVYGDTTVPVYFMGRFYVNHTERTPSKKRIERAVKKAIRKHDLGSQIAAEEAARGTDRQSAIKSLNKEFNDRLMVLPKDEKELAGIRAHNVDYANYPSLQWSEVNAVRGWGSEVIS